MGKVLSEMEKQVNKVLNWSAGGKETTDLAEQVQLAKRKGEVIQPTQKNIATTIRGAMKMFLDGDILSPDITKKMQESGLDMKNLRSNLVEQTLARAIPKIINSGDIERLEKIATLAGEEIAPQEPPKRERVILEITETEEVKEYTDAEYKELRQDS